MPAGSRPRSRSSDLALVAAFQALGGDPADWLRRFKVARADPHVRAAHVLAPDAHVGPILQHAEQLDLDALRHLADLVDQRIPGYNFDMAEGVTYELDVTKPFGQRIQNLKFKGQPVNPTQKFRVVTNNYRVNGGGGFTMLKNAPVKKAIYTEIRDLMIDYVKEEKVIDPKKTFQKNWEIVPAGVVGADGEHYR